VSVDGQPFRKLSFTTSVNLAPGQSFSFVVNSPGSSKTYYVRCLPTDFPSWTTERPGKPQAQWYIVTSRRLGTGYHPFAIVLDNHGVPVWWYRVAGERANDAKLLPNGHIAWISTASSLSTPSLWEVQLDGSLVRMLSPNGLDGH